MTPSLSGHISIFGLVFFVLKFLLGIARQQSREKVAKSCLVFFVLKFLLGIARQQSREKVAILPQKPGVSVQIKN